MTKLSYERNGKTYTIESGDVVGGLDYLLQYGFSQSLQDSIAGRAKAVRDELTTRPEGNTDWNMPDEATIEAAIAEDIDGMLQKRMNAILAGTVAVRGSAAPRDPAAGIVRELLVAWAKAKGKKLPKADSDEYAQLAAKMREVKADHIKAELARRAEAAADIEIDLD